MVKEKKKKVKVPFWKKFDPEITHITNHAGKIIDNSNITQVIDAFLYFGLAYAGVEATGDLRGALIGPLGLKLASSQNIVAGASGIAILAVLGLASMGEITSPPRKENGKTVIDINDPITGAKTKSVPLHCEWVAGALGKKDQCRCWYPGLGWRYVDKSLCAS